MPSIECLTAFCNVFWLGVLICGLCLRFHLFACSGRIGFSELCVYVLFGSWFVSIVALNLLSVCREFSIDY